MFSLVTAALAVVFAIFNVALFFASVAAWAWTYQHCPISAHEKDKVRYLFSLPCGPFQWLPYCLLTASALIGLIISAAYIIRPLQSKAKRKLSRGPVAALLLYMLLLVLIFTLGWTVPQSFDHDLIDKRPERTVIFTWAHNEWPPQALSAAHPPKGRSLSNTWNKRGVAFHPSSATEVVSESDTADHIMLSKLVPRSHEQNQDQGVFFLDADQFEQEWKLDLSTLPSVDEENLQPEEQSDLSTPKDKKVSNDNDTVNEKKTREKKKKKDTAQNAVDQYNIERDFASVHGVTGSFLYHVRKGGYGPNRASIILAHLAFFFGTLLAITDFLVSESGDKPKKLDGNKQRGSSEGV